MPALTPSFVFDLERNMRLVAATDYQRLTENLWWTKMAKLMTSSAKTERVSWLLDTAKIERTITGGGQVTFEDMVLLTTEFVNLNAAAGLKLKKEQLEDLDGNGVQLATGWARMIGAYAAYWPQKMLAAALIANPITYDGQAFFSAAHPVNPQNTALGTFQNVFTGAAAGLYPGAVPIDISVTVDVAVNNLQKIIAYIAGVKMPNGVDPRFLRTQYIFHPPALAARVQQILNAKFIAQAAVTGGGSADITGAIANWGFGIPVQIDELASAFGGSDTTYYIGTKDILSSELGAFVYVNREPFSIVFNGPQTDAELARKRELQWTTEGRNVIGAGHPFLLYQCKAA